ncbi:MAG TPA: alpha/beta hydrolase [Ktedonobacterales bacterium]
MNHPAAGYAEVNGTRLYYEVVGSGHPLTLIHGALVNRGLWDDQVAAFAERYTVIRYDMRGFGDSALVKADQPPYSASADLYALLQFLGIEHTYLMGLSAGGGLAIDFTIEHPEMVDAPIAVAAGLSGFAPESSDESSEGEAEEPWQQVVQALQQGEIDRAVELNLRYWTDGPRRAPEQVNAQTRERVRAMTAANYRRGDDPGVWPQFIEPPAAGRLAEIKVPTLVMYGDQDVREVAEVAQALERGIKGAKKVVISDTAHHLNLEKPAEFNRVVLDFLAALPQP